MAKAKQSKASKGSKTPPKRSAKGAVVGQDAGPLTARQLIFVREYLVDFNATQAAIRAGYSVKSAAEIGRQLLDKTGVAKVIAEAVSKRAEKLELSADWVLREWFDIARADARELSSWHVERCDACWPGGLPEETERDAIDPDCMGCYGKGRGRVVITDTRELTGPAAKLYAGVQVGKDGIKVNLHSKMDAPANIARHLLMFPSRVELTGKDGGPVQRQEVLQDLSALSLEELAVLEALNTKSVAAAGDPIRRTAFCVRQTFGK